MSDLQGRPSRTTHGSNLLERLGRRGVLRVAVSYAVIGWLLLQIGDVVLEPLNAPPWALRALIIVVAAGFPVALALAWFFELGPQGVTVDRLPEQAQRPVTRGLRRYADGIVIALLLAIIALLLAREGGLLETDAGPPVLGVLPFAEIGNPAETYFGDGLSDTLIHKLGQVSGLVVLAPSSTFEFRDPALDLADVARKLGANVLLTGSVQRAQGNLRVNARLVDPRTGRQQWAASFDRGASDVFAVQDEIAELVTASLEVVLAPAEEARLARHQTENLPAYDAFLRGRSGIAARTAGSMDGAIAALREAIELDPDFALAHAALAEAYFLASSYSFFNWPWKAVSREAHAAAARAQALDPDLGEAWLAQALVAMGDNGQRAQKPAWSRSYIEALLEKAVELSPNNAIAWKFYAGHTDDPRAAFERMERAARLDPRSGIILLNLGGYYQDLQEPIKARQFYLASLDTAEPVFELGLFTLMGSYFDHVSGMATAVRWGRFGHRLAAGEFGALWRDYGLALLQLGAWEELDSMLREAEGDPGSASGPSFLYRVGLRTRYLRAVGDPGAAASARSFLEAVDQVFQGPTRTMDPDAPPATVLTALVLQLLRDGDSSGALAFIDERFPDLPAGAPLPLMLEGINMRILRAVALKHSGDAEAAEEALGSYLAALETLPVAGVDGTGFLAFSLHAFLGETEEAIAAFDRAVDAGYALGWWGLKDGAVDADYARVWADSRLQKRFRELEDVIAGQREDFRRAPDVPTEDLVLAGFEAQ